jgi:hypothetical protein
MKIPEWLKEYLNPSQGRTQIHDNMHLLMVEGVKWKDYPNMAEALRKGVIKDIVPLLVKGQNEEMKNKQIVAGLTIPTPTYS